MSSLYMKLIGAGVLALAIGAFVLSYINRGREIEALENWQVAVQVAVTDATVEPDKKGVRKLVAPESVVPAINALKNSLDNCAGTLDGITERSLAAEQISRVLDEGLADLLKAQDRQGATLNKRLESLSGRTSTGDRDLDCKAMEADSTSAWEGWRQ